MNERTFEIILSRYPRDFFPAGWELEGQQIGVAGGTLDLLFRDATGLRHIVEVKKGPATIEAVDQVLRYAQALTTHDASYVPWVVAHRIPREVAPYARMLGVWTLAISIEDCERVLAKHGQTLASMVELPRRTPGALTGGAGDVWAAVENDVAFAEMTDGMAGNLRALASRPDFRLNSGRMQTIIRYRGVKLGGVNRRNSPHGYITSGVAASDKIRERLLALGFVWKEKPGKAHVHTWYQVPIHRYAAFAQAIDLAKRLVDQSLGTAM